MTATEATNTLRLLAVRLRGRLSADEQRALTEGESALQRRCATCGAYDAHGGGRGFCTNSVSYFSGQAMPAEEGCSRWRRE